MVFDRDLELNLISYILQNPKAFKTYGKSLKDKHFIHRSASIFWEELYAIFLNQTVIGGVQAKDYVSPTELEFRNHLKPILGKKHKLSANEVEDVDVDLRTVYITTTTPLTGKYLHSLYLQREKEQLVRTLNESSVDQLRKDHNKLKRALENIAQESADTEEVCFSLFSKDGIEKASKLVVDMHEGTTTVSSGWSLVDYLLAGGLRRGELSCFLGPTGTGKSLCLFNLATNVYKAGGRVLYFVLDNTLADISERLHAVACGIPIPEKGEEGRSGIDLETYKNFIYSSLPGQRENERFLLKVWPPKRKKASDLKFAIERIQERSWESDKASGLPQYSEDDYELDGSGRKLVDSQGNFILKPNAEELWGRIDLVCVDYGDLFAPERANEALHISLAGSFEEMRAIAVELDIAIFTATQTSKAGAAAENIQLGHVSNSWDCLMGISNIIGLAQTPEEKRMNLLRWEFLKCRRLDSTGYYIVLKIESRYQKLIQAPGHYEVYPITKGGLKTGENSRNPFSTSSGREIVGYDETTGEAIYSTLKSDRERLRDGELKLPPLQYGIGEEEKEEFKRTLTAVIKSSRMSSGDPSAEEEIEFVSNSADPKIQEAQINGYWDEED